MLPIIKSEARKLLTIRSTYILLAFSFALIVFFCLYVEGYRGLSGSPAATLMPGAFHEAIAGGVGSGVTFIAIVAILFVAHEYRHNLIMYTLTANVRRGKVLAAKLFVMLVLGTVFAVVAFGVALGSYLLGVSLRDATLPAQNFVLWQELGRTIFYSVGYVLIGMLIAMVTRSVVIGIVALFLVPSTVEPLLGILLKENAKYLPFSALDSTIGTSMAVGATLSPGNAVLVSTAYLLGAIAVTWVLFSRRDAN